MVEKAVVITIIACLSLVIIAAGQNIMNDALTFFEGTYEEVLLYD